MITTAIRFSSAIVLRKEILDPLPLDQKLLRRINWLKGCLIIQKVVTNRWSE